MTRIRLPITGGGGSPWRIDLPTTGGGGGGGTGNPSGGVVIGWVVANPSQNVEVLRAPDSSGSPDTANEISLAVLPPGVSGYTDLTATPNLTFYHYRVRHVFPGYTAGTATQYIRVHGIEFIPGQTTPPPPPHELFSGGGAAAGDVQSGTIGVFTIRGVLGVGPDASGLATATLSVAHNRPSANATDAWTATGGEGTSGGSSLHSVGYFAGQRLDLNAQNPAGSFTHVHAGAISDATVILDDSSGTPGTLANYYGLRFTQPQRSAAVSVTNLYGIRIETITRTWITNSYGLYIDTVSGGATLNYAIYAAGGNFTVAGSSGTNFSPTSTVVGVQSIASATGTSGTQTSVYSDVKQTVATTGTTIAVEGIGQATHTSGTVVQIMGLDGIVKASGVGGTTTHARAVVAGGNLSAGTVTNFVNFYAAAPATGATITNAYGLYVEAVSAGATLNYAIYTNAGPVRVGSELRVAGDVAGEAAHNTITGTSDVTANSTGVGTIIFKGATSRDSTGFIKIYVGTTAYYIPFFSAITG